MENRKGRVRRQMSRGVPMRDDAGWSQGHRGDRRGQGSILEVRLRVSGKN